MVTNMQPEGLARLATLEELHTERAVTLAANWPGDEADAFHHAAIVLALRAVRAELTEAIEQRHAMQRRAESAEADWQAARAETWKAAAAVARQRYAFVLADELLARATAPREGS